MTILDIFEVFKNRKSSRHYLRRPIPEETIHQIVNTARLAPSAGNIQPWHFIVVRDKRNREKIAQGCIYGKFLSQSPVVIIACGDKQASSRWYIVDTSIALEHIVLAATVYNLGTCWIGMFDEEEIRTMVSIPENFEIVALLALGYTREKRDFWAKILHTIRPRKKLRDIVSWESYGRTDH